MSPDDQPDYTTTMHGTISCFLTANKFRVQLHDGQLVTAVLPDPLIEQIRPYYTGDPIADRIGVIVQFRPPPALHLITQITGDGGWCGAPRTPWR